MRYYLARRNRATIGNYGANVHTELGVATTVARARGKLQRALLVEACFLQQEAEGRQTMLARAARLNRAADDVVRLADDVYAYVEVDGVRYGWYRTTGTDTDDLE